MKKAVRQRVSPLVDVRYASACRFSHPEPSLRLTYNSHPIIIASSANAAGLRLLLHRATRRSFHQLDVIQAILLAFVAFAGCGDDPIVGRLQKPAPFTFVVLEIIINHSDFPSSIWVAGLAGMDVQSGNKARSCGKTHLWNAGYQ
jgi:hypothetical protein